MKFKTVEAASIYNVLNSNALGNISSPVSMAIIKAKKKLESTQVKLVEDINDVKTKYGVLDEEGNIIKKESVENPVNIDDFQWEDYKTAKELIEELNKKEVDIEFDITGIDCCKKLYKTITKEDGTQTTVEITVGERILEIYPQSIVELFDKIGIITNL